MENAAIDHELLSRLVSEARSVQMGVAEYREQRVSFVYGQMNGALTKDEVRAKLAANYGWDGAHLKTPSPASE